MLTYDYPNIFQRFEVMDRELKDHRILIVDDALENVEILGSILSDYKRSVALSGEKALEIAAGPNRPDLVLLDVMMPGMDGFTVCSKLKSNPGTKDIPVIFVTSMKEVSEKVKGFSLGAVDYITKPYQVEEIRSRIKTHLTISALRNKLTTLNHELEKKVKDRTEELLIAKNQAEESSRVKSHFLALMSHELRTPMAGILGFSDFLLEELKDEESRELVKMINDSGRRLKSTLDSILNFSQIESQKIKANYSDFEIISKSKSLLEYHELNAKLKGLELSFGSESEQLAVRLDEVMYEIIFNNLVSNAIKYTNEGNVRVEIKSGKAGKENVTSLIVSDTGIGIPPEKQEAIFEEFRQVDEGLRRNFEGVGLGLSLVKKYVELMGGQITVSSKVKEGSVFTIKFSDAQQPKSKINSVTGIKEGGTIYGARAGQYPSRDARILLVEDDYTNIKIAQLYLKDVAILDVAKNSDEALDLAKKTLYSAILMDINLGKGMSGLELTKILRKDNKYSNVPIVAYTAFALDGDRENFIEEGCTHYLPKPCSRDELISLLAEVI